MRKSRLDNFTKDEIENICKESQSIREVSLKLGYSDQNGSAYKTIRKYIEKNKIDISHFPGKYKTDKRVCKSTPLETYLVNPKKVRNDTLKRKLVENKIFEYKCACCGNDMWMGQQIPIELHHKDGNNLNNTLENLEFLCPNCHALTDSYCRAKIHKSEYITENEWIEAIQQNPNIYQTLIYLNLKPIGANYQTAKSIMEKYNLSF